MSKVKATDKTCGGTQSLAIERGSCHLKDLGRKTVLLELSDGQLRGRNSGSSGCPGSMKLPRGGLVLKWDWTGEAVSSRRAEGKQPRLG